jgi:hypothetical protein
MKIVKHEVIDDKRVEMFFDKLEITYQDMFKLPQDPRFIQIGKENNLTCNAWRHPGSWEEATGELWTKMGPDDDSTNKQVYSMSRLGRRILVHKDYANVAEAVFYLTTETKLKTLWQAYCKEKGIPTK